MIDDVLSNSSNLEQMKSKKPEKLYEKNAKGTYLYIRHGETNYNVILQQLGKEVAGVNPLYLDMPLNEQGIKQSLELGEALKDFHIQVVFTSPLRRCLETAYNSLKNHPQKENFKIIICPFLTETVSSTHDYSVNIFKKKEFFSKHNLGLDFDWTMFEEFFPDLGDQEFYYLKFIDTVDEKDERNTQILTKFSDIIQEINDYSNSYEMKKEISRSNNSSPVKKNRVSFIEKSDNAPNDINKENRYDLQNKTLENVNKNLDEEKNNAKQELNFDDILGLEEDKQNKLHEINQKYEKELFDKIKCDLGEFANLYCKVYKKKPESIHHMFNRSLNCKEIFSKISQDLYRIKQKKKISHSNIGNEQPYESSLDIYAEKVLVFTHSAFIKISTSSKAYEMQEIDCYPDDCVAVKNCEMISINI